MSGKRNTEVMLESATSNAKVAKLKMVPNRDHLISNEHSLLELSKFRWL